MSSKRRSGESDSSSSSSEDERKHHKRHHQSESDSESGTGSSSSSSSSESSSSSSSSSSSGSDRRSHKRPSKKDKKKHHHSKDSKDSKKKSKSSHKKDQKAPKRAKTALQQFQVKKRAEVKAELEKEGLQHGPKEINQRLSEMWGKLTAEEKKPYDELAAVDRKRFQEEKAVYAAQMKESDSESDSDDDKKKKSKRKKKDPNAPKRAKTAYLFFTEEKRKEVTEFLRTRDGDKYDNKNVLQELGTRWKAINQEEKAKYTALADADRTRYQTELQGYRSTKE